MSPWNLAVVCAVPLLVSCGKVEQLAQPLRPSLSEFAEQVQPVFEAQGCSRAVCHGQAPSGQGRLKLVSTPGGDPNDPDVLSNYQGSAALVNLKAPAESILVQSPFLGEGGDVDHPEYYGRFTTTTDCCYCGVLEWICEESEDEACVACRTELEAGCTCDAVPRCAVSGEEVTPAAVSNPTWFDEIGPLLQLEDSCAAGDCHTGPEGQCPDVFDVSQVVRADNPCQKDDEAPWLMACQLQPGTFLDYALAVGRGANEAHSAVLSPPGRARIQQWIVDLGAPKGRDPEGGGGEGEGEGGGEGEGEGGGRPHCAFVDACREDPGVAPGGSVTYCSVVRPALDAVGCNTCHGGASMGGWNSETYAALFLPGGRNGDPNIVACCGDGEFMRAVREEDGQGMHAGKFDDQQKQDIEDWITVHGAPQGDGCD